MNANYPRPNRCPSAAQNNGVQRMKHIRRICLVVLILSTLCWSRPPNAAAQTETTRRVNVPYFDGDIPLAQTAIFWFGQVNRADNYTDVRIGYNQEELYLWISTFDRRLWYDTSPSPQELENWDAATVYLDLDGPNGTTPDANAHRFVGQLNWYEPRDSYQAAYQGTGSTWAQATTSFTTESAYRGEGGLNQDADDRGWVLKMHIPFESLGLAGPPPQGTVWGLAVVAHDRDDQAGSPRTAHTWPEQINQTQPATWGELAFGLPTYDRPAAAPAGTVTIRHNLNGADVPDAAVGGYATCGEGLDFWSEWGDTNEAFYNPERTDFNIQNQTDVGDWPCFSKYYVTFPLDAVPADKQILTATLTLHQYSNAGGGSWGTPDPSLIQAFAVDEPWDETTLTWNNAPMAMENVAASWVSVRTDYDPYWPGIPRTWDVTRAAAEAYAADTPLRLALYSADTEYHSGKYFVASGTGDWNDEARPTLNIIWGNAATTFRKQVSNSTPTQGQQVTYALFFSGTGQTLTLVDNLPDELSAPGPIQVSAGPAAQYDLAAHRLTWSDSPPAGQPVTITFPVTVQAYGPRFVLNTATLTDLQGEPSIAAALLVVDGLQLWLPGIAFH